MTSHKLLSLLPNTRLLLLLHIKRKREIVDKEWSWNYARHHVGEIASPRSDNYYVIDRPKKICCPSADNKSWNTWIGARRKPRANGDTLIHLAGSVMIVVKHFHFFRHKSLVYYSIQQRYFTSIAQRRCTNGFAVQTLRRSKDSFFFHYLNYFLLLH